MSFKIENLGTIAAKEFVPPVAIGKLQGREVKVFPKDSIKAGAQNKDVDGCVMLFLIPVYIVAAIAGLFEVIFTGGKSHCCWDGMSGTQSTKGGL